MPRIHTVADIAPLPQNPSGRKATARFPTELDAELQSLDVFNRASDFADEACAGARSGQAMLGEAHPLTETVGAALLSGLSVKDAGFITGVLTGIAAALDGAA